MNAEAREFWNAWNRAYREEARLDPATAYRADRILDDIGRLGLARGARILEVGCGTGWMCGRLSRFGQVTGIDLADEVVARARSAMPSVRLISGDFVEGADVGEGYDLAVTMEVLSHVSDHARFVDRLHASLKVGGRLLITSQNRFVWERRSDVSPLARGQLRRWFDRRELVELLSRRFRILGVTSLLPAGHLGILRLANSPKLNAALAGAMGARRLVQLKERLSLGQSLYVHAIRDH